VLRVAAQRSKPFAQTLVIATWLPNRAT
jgi:hypothetical protein